VDFKFGFVDASYQAISTLAFVCPENALPKIMEQLRTDIDPSTINALSEAEFGIWETPEGMTYVDGEQINHRNHAAFIALSLCSSLLSEGRGRSQEGERR
jgi:hypothetical protein